MVKSSLVSVIIVNYNGREFIGECIDAVLASNYSNFEIIVVDNASIDNSFAYLKKRYGKNRKVKIISSDTQLYFAGGSNLGAKKASGDLLFFLNSDTVIEQNCIDKLVKFSLNQNSNLIQPKILMYNKKNTIDNTGGKLTLYGVGYGRGHGEKIAGQYDQDCKIDFVNGTAFMINRDFFYLLGSFDERFRFFYEDVDLSLRARQVGGESWYCHSAVIYHQGGASLKRTMSTWKIKKEIWQSIILLSQKRIKSWHKTLVNKHRLQELTKIVGRAKFSLLDLGCGDGGFVHLAHQVGIVAIGVDKKTGNTTALHSTKVKEWFIHSSIEDFRIRNKFDVVTLYHVLEHVEDSRKVLQKVRTLLKKNGILVLEVPLVGNLTENFLGKSYFAYHDPNHHHFFTKKELYHLLTEQDYRIINKGNTLYEFPLTVITTSFRRSLLHGILGLFVFLPLKLATLLGYNTEIIRLYLRRF